MFLLCTIIHNLFRNRTGYKFQKNHPSEEGDRRKCKEKPGPSTQDPYEDPRTPLTIPNDHSKMKASQRPSFLKKSQKPDHGYDMVLPPYLLIFDNNFGLPYIP